MASLQQVLRFTCMRLILIRTAVKGNCQLVNTGISRMGCKRGSTPNKLLVACSYTFFCATYATFTGLCGSCAHLKAVSSIAFRVFQRDAAPNQSYSRQGLIRIIDVAAFRVATVHHSERAVSARRRRPARLTPRYYCPIQDQACRTLAALPVARKRSQLTLEWLTRQ
jgi:hypothetical protein